MLGDILAAVVKETIKLPFTIINGAVEAVEDIADGKI
jgi:hypothetical protein